MRRIKIRCRQIISSPKLCVLILATLLFMTLVWRRNSVLVPNATYLHILVPNRATSFPDAQFQEDSSLSAKVGFSELSSSNCTAAFKGKAKNSDFLEKIPRVSADVIASNASNGCQRFRQLYGFNRYPEASQEEKNFPLAYIILFHKDLDQVLYLLRAIYHPHNVYCLNVDINSGQAFIDNVKAISKCIPNTFVPSKLEQIVYAGFSRLQSDINCMGELLESKVVWRYAINMPGQQFPLRTNLETVRILRLYNDTNDVEGLGGNRMIPHRYKFKHIYYKDKKTGRMAIRRTAETKADPPHGLEIVKGSAYGAFSRAFVGFVIHDQVAIDFLAWCQNVYSPDEYFWATLHHSKTVPVPGRYTGPLDGKKWIAAFASWGGENSCATIRIRGVCIFSPEDLPLLVGRQELFANKFYFSHHPAALHCLDQQLYQMTVSKTVRDLSFYKTMPYAVKSL